eukprot:c20048_g1_i4.p1 GENE.c20048_g1_i4~~c20048_g1_i4.p1  ORF type:complete len:386 (+),score=48.21 c20048_g1_i4:42-1199(+)
MRMINHPNVVKLQEVLSTEKCIYLVMEYINGGDLIDRVEKKGRMRDKEANLYFRQLVEGVAYCHGHGVCHRDLKPENLLIDTSTQTLKISDFGLSALSNSKNSFQQSLQYTSCGTPNYIAPEMLSGKGYDGRKADIWSIGVILFVILAGQLPFDEASVHKLYKKISTADCYCPAWISADAKSLIKKILVPDPESRITIEEIKAHPWYTKFDLTCPCSYESNHSTFSTASTLSAASVTSIACEESHKSLQIKKSTIPTPDINAFELIGLCCGIDHSLILSAPGTESSQYSKFYSDHDPKVILRSISSALESLKIYHKVFASSSTVKAQKTGITPLRFEIRVISVIDKVSIVKISREKGVSKDFNVVCKELFGLLRPVISGDFSSVQ